MKNKALEPVASTSISVVRQTQGSCYLRKKRRAGGRATHLMKEDPTDWPPAGLRRVE